MLLAIVMIAVAMIPVVITMIAVAVMGMMHGYVIALDEALTIILALPAVYGWMPEHTRTVRVHSTVILHIEAGCFDAVVKALPADFAELGRRCVPLSGIALLSVVIVVSLLRTILLRAILLRTILLSMQTDGGERSQCNCQKRCCETNGSH